MDNNNAQALPSPLQQVQQPLLLEEKIRCFQYRLSLVIHAHFCMHREILAKKTGQDSPLCNYQHCNSAKLILRHMMSCENRWKCPHTVCLAFRTIFSHWTECRKEECPACKPVNLKLMKSLDKVDEEVLAADRSFFQV